MLAAVTESNGASKKTKIVSTGRNAKYRQLIIAGTVDGKVSALNAEDGSLLWTADLGNGPLVSSSVTRLLYKDGGKVIRLIPSLHGGLFKFDGESLESVSFDADQLVSSSFKLASEEALVGGKTTRMDGLDLWTGKTLYSCSTTGCTEQHSVYESNDVLIVKRQQHTIRSIENRSGMENWNFSVGEINLDFSKGSVARLLQGSGENLNYEASYKEEDIFNTIDVRCVKVIVPDGTVYLVKKKDKHIINWKHQFGVPITSAWLFVDGSFQKLDLLEPMNVPALEETTASGKNAPTQAIYLGSYKDSIYIQSSLSIPQNTKPKSMSYVQGTSLAHYDSQRFVHQPHFVKTKTITVSNGNDYSDKRNDLLSLNGPTNPFEGAYYVQKNLACLPGGRGSKKSGKTRLLGRDIPDENADVDISFYIMFLPWKEAMMVCITLAIAVILQCFLIKKAARTTTLTGDYSKTIPQPEASSVSLEREYQSRFLQDFEPQECLGKGGFGLVFNARNKMDDCSYAVKRILLPSIAKEREKVLREVRVLAKLDHPSIVRYFNAWSEQPPVGWQEKQDEILIGDDSSYWSQDPDAGKTLHKSKRCSSKNALYRFSDDQGKVYKNEATGIINSELENDDNAFNIQTSQGFSFHSNNSNVHNLCDDIPPGSKFFQHSSSESECTESFAQSDANFTSENIEKPFQRYEDTLSIVFEESDPPASKHTSNDSANWEMSEKDLPQTTKKSSSCQKKQIISKKGLSKKEQKKQSHTQRSGDTLYLYIQMQLCKKQSLKDWLSANVNDRDNSFCLRIFRQVVDAVKYIHDCNLIHRDLKPSNVLFSLDDTVKVGDFGLVTTSGDEVYSVESDVDDEEYNSATSHTQHVGTRLYMAPEQMTSKKYCEKVDIFALGLILFELKNTFNTYMEKVRTMTNARRLKFPFSFQKNYPREADLAFSMLNVEAALRPSAQEIGQHELLLEHT
ncbi:unnamed protein product [Clavelina lepadiformis]|uniref:PRKR-like endoplasmic reticulum kinase n=1 Tax=Clavelina lepadiformis TaxID=159417 RepID=A0ABP0FSL4_CLALP